jgi:hypothetical protein
MIPREVTIGRAADNDIRINPQYSVVSNHHAVIYSTVNGLMYRDTSTNGTLINGMNVHNQEMAIRYGDSILLAGRLPLSWDKLNIYFPAGEFGSSAATSSTTFNNPNYAGNNPLEAQAPSTSSGYSTEVEITRFNWGAFFMYPIWGFANGMWWLFFLSMVIGWLSPIPNVIFGVMGSKWAWKSKQWRDINHFVEVQRSWKKWGIGVFIVSLSISLICAVILFAFSSLLY